MLFGHAADVLTSLYQYLGRHVERCIISHLDHCGCLSLTRSLLQPLKKFKYLLNNEACPKPLRLAFKKGHLFRFSTRFAWDKFCLA